MCVECSILKVSFPANLSERVRDVRPILGSLKVSCETMTDIGVAFQHAEPMVGSADCGGCHETDRPSWSVAVRLLTTTVLIIT